MISCVVRHDDVLRIANVVEISVQVTSDEF